MQRLREVITLSGELDLNDRLAVREILKNASGSVAIDLSEMRYIDAAILGEFARLAKRIAPLKPKLIAVPPHVRRILDIVEFQNILDY